jgi:hypothetical protein
MTPTAFLFHAPPTAGSLCLLRLSLASSSQRRVTSVPTGPFFGMFRAHSTQPLGKESYHSQPSPPCLSPRMAER